ncbi:MAG: hypothetical protein M0Z58_03395 [Nitrospiraceae bacterium]|nr:hypothetical protein [Nitrospiraceae bacterium]
MRLVSVLLVVFTVCCGVSPAAAGPAAAGSVAERVKARGFVRCGSAPRPGLAEMDGRGRWSGLDVDICRAIAAAVLGSPDCIEYHEYETPKQFDAVRKQQDDVFFLTGSEINGQELAGSIVPGPTVFVESHAVMVPSNAAARHVCDLAGDTICFLSGSPAERSLSSYFGTRHKNWLRLPFSEEGEMDDAYNVQHCHAIAGEITALAASRLAPGVNRLSSRILPETLSVFPVIAATGTEDAQWSSIVAWTVITLVSAERPETRWYAGGAGAMPVKAPGLGLDRGWQRRVLAAVGNYGDIYERRLGKGSRLRLRRGLNENLLKGGLLLAPFIE